MRAQVFTIALVVASGIAVFVSSLSTYKSLERARDDFYRTSRFADAFADLRRAPLSLRDDIAAIPGVSAFELRIVRDSILDIPGSREPVVGRFVSLPPDGGTALNRVQLQRGRLPHSSAAAEVPEVLVSEGFAKANGYRVGDGIAALFQGRYRKLHIVGLAVSPEYIYALRGDSPFPDDKHFGVFWMQRDALAAAADLEGSFNSLALLYSPAGSPESVLDALDRLLKPYGGGSAYDRAKQVSNVFVTNEIGQQYVMATVIPLIFLSVAAFLINVVVSRLVQTQRGQIAVLKAVGYSDATVAVHYALLVSALILPGALSGLGLGAWFGYLSTEMYKLFFHFPTLHFIFDPIIAFLGLLVSFVTALAGGAGVLIGVLRTPPAEAMRPQTPPVYRAGWMERWNLHRFFSVSGRLALRNLGLHKLRTVFSFLGVSFSVLIVVLGLFWSDTLDYIFYAHFGLMDRADATVTFETPLPSRALHEIERYPGVIHAEGYRLLGVRLFAGHRSEESAVTGMPPDARLRILRDTNLQRIDVPPDGLMLGASLAEKLGVRAGDVVRLEPLLETDRFHVARVAVLPLNSNEIELRVVAVAEELLGGGAYMNLDALRRLLGESRTVNQIALDVDEAYAEELYARLKAAPRVQSVAGRASVLRTIEETTAGTIEVFAGILITFAVSIAFGVVYNTARVSLSERSWELATLRVLGFSRLEVFRVLAWELSFQTAPALLPGCALGFVFVVFLIRLMPVDGIRFPIIVSISSFALAVVVVLIAGLLSAWFIHRRIDRLDMVGVLKSRE